MDLGIGTGALAAHCLEVRPGARIIGIDTDEGMLESARERLLRNPSLELIHGDFGQVPVPTCDAVVASLALHHIPSPDTCVPGAVWEPQPGAIVVAPPRRQPAPRTATRR
ncbi:class I SAM-dependent methyltransferase [Gemmatimonadota bacterium]